MVGFTEGLERVCVLERDFDLNIFCSAELIKLLVNNTFNGKSNMIISTENTLLLIYYSTVFISMFFCKWNVHMSDPLKLIIYSYQTRVFPNLYLKRNINIIQISLFPIRCIYKITTWASRRSSRLGPRLIFKWRVTYAIVSRWYLIIISLKQRIMLILFFAKNTLMKATKNNSTGKGKNISFIVGMLWNLIEFNIV